jgi:hypothetical protein
MRTEFDLAVIEVHELEAALARECPPETLACGKCGSTHFSETRSRWGVALAVFLMLKMTIIFPPKKLKRCLGCGFAE